jgi:hypothetical protein
MNLGEAKSIVNGGIESTRRVLERCAFDVRRVGILSVVIAGLMAPAGCGSSDSATATSVSSARGSKLQSEAQAAVVRCNDAVPRDLADLVQSDRSLMRAAIDACAEAAGQLQAAWEDSDRPGSGPGSSYVPATYLELNLLELNSELTNASNEIGHQSYHAEERDDLLVAVINFRSVAVNYLK